MAGQGHWNGVWEGRIESCRRVPVLHYWDVTRSLIQLLLGLLTQAVFASGMTSDEVARVLAQAISRAQQIEPHAVIAVVDREGFVLAVWRVDNHRPRDQDLPVAVLDAITTRAARLPSNRNYRWRP